MCLIEDLLSTTFAQVVPHLKFTPPPFPRMDYETAIEKVATCVVYSVTVSCIIVCSSNIFVYGLSSPIAVIVIINNRQIASYGMSVDEHWV